MSTSIWNAAAGTPTATHRIPVDTSGAGTPTMYTVQQVADLGTSVGTSVNALGSIGTNTSIDLSLGGFVSATITGNLTFSFTNPAAGGTEFTLVLTNGGAHTITWPASVTWAGATAPTLMASGTDVLRFTSGNGGTTWYGWHERDEATAPGGSNTHVQFNDSGAFGGQAGLAYNKTTGALTIGSRVLGSDGTSLYFAGGVYGLSYGSGTLVPGSAGTYGTFSAGTIASRGGTGFLLENTALIYPLNSGAMILNTSQSAYVAIGSSQLNLYGPSNTTTDTVLTRDAAGVVAQRNGTNAQTFRVYGTYTDASNYVRASLGATSTTVTVTAETAGTGADNVPVVITPAGTSQVEVGNGVQFTEMTAPSAPGANKVILFAQDNGAGKTQLMALFPSGAAQQVAIEP